MAKVAERDKVATCHHCDNHRLREESRKNDWEWRKNGKGRLRFSLINYICLDCWRQTTLRINRREGE